MGNQQASKEQGSASIAQLVKSITGIQSQMSKAQRYNSFCFVVGLTGSGKSTFISYCCGAKPNFEKTNDGDYHIENTESRFPKIGNTQQSCTTTPSVFTSPEQLVFYDPPGFMDTKGAYQQIINSYSIANIFTLGSSAKIIIVVEQSTLKSGRGKSFVDLVQRLKRLFANKIQQLANSCFLVISKVNDSDTKSKQLIAKIKRIIQENKSLEQDVAIVLKTLIKLQRIACFPCPTEINQNLLKSLKIQISKLPLFKIQKEVTIPLSSQGKNEIINLMSHIKKELSTIIETIGKELKVPFLKNLQDKRHIEDSLMKIRQANKMILDKELNIRIPSNLNELHSKLLIKQEHIDKLKECMSQLMFCLTIDPKLDVPTQVTFKLEQSICQIQKQLDLALINISSKQYSQSLFRQQAVELQKQAAQFKRDKQIMQRQLENQEDRLRQQAQKYNQQVLKQTRLRDQKQQRHQAQIAKINQKNLEIAKTNQSNKVQQFNKLKKLMQEQEQKHKAQVALYTSNIQKLQSQTASQKTKISTLETKVQNIQNKRCEIY